MIQIEKMTVADAPAVFQVIQTVHDRMEHPEWYCIDHLEVYTHYLEDGHGIGYKAVDTEKQQIAGIFIALIPENKEDNLGYDANLSEEECKHTAVMETVAVLPEYRGLKLQYRLMQETEAELRRLGFKYLTGTIHPDNKYSLNNALIQNYKVVKTKEKYGGRIRHIILKTLEE